MSCLVVFGATGKKTLILSVHTEAVPTQPEHTDPRRAVPGQHALHRLEPHASASARTTTSRLRRAAGGGGHTPKDGESEVEHKSRKSSTKDVVQPSVRLSCSEGLVQKYLRSRFPFFFVVCFPMVV